MNRKIASGSVYQSAYTDKHGVTHKSSKWSIKYYVNGKPRVESTGTEDRKRPKPFCGVGSTRPR